MSLVAGDVILFSTYVGAEIQDEGQDYLIMRETDVIAVVEKE